MGRWHGVRLFGVVLVVAVLAATSVSTAAPAPRRGGTLRFALIGEPPTLDPSATTVGVTANVGSSIFEGLFAFDRSWRPQPMLVESYTISPDGRTYTFRLRRNVFFHNDKELTADDVVASLNRWGKVGSRGAVVYQSVDSVSVQDKYTVIVRLKEPFAALLAFLALPSSMAAIMPKEIAEGTPVGPVKEFVGTGPYRFVEWAPNRHIRLARWAKYSPRTETPNLYAGRREALADEVIFYPVGNVATRVAGVQTGEFDVADSISTDLYAQLKTDQRVVPVIVDRGTWLVFFFNKKSALTSNVKLRQAISLALTMQPILQVTIGNPDLYSLSPSLYPRGTPWYSEDGSQWYNVGDVERAKTLAAEAGYKGEPIRWLTTLQYDWMFKSTTVATTQLRRAGFNIQQQVYEWAGVVERRAKPAEWEMFTTGHGFVPDPSLIDVFSPAYPGWWDSPAKTELFRQFNRAVDLQERQRLWRRLHELVYTEASWVKTGEFFFVHLRAKALEGFTPAPWFVTWNLPAIK